MHSLANYLTSLKPLISLALPWGFSGGPECKASACSVGDPGLIPGSGRSPPGGGNGNQAQYYCLENPMDGGAW